MFFPRSLHIAFYEPQTAIIHFTCFFQFSWSLKFYTVFVTGPLWLTCVNEPYCDWLPSVVPDSKSNPGCNNTAYNFSVSRLLNFYRLNTFHNITETWSGRNSTFLIFWKYLHSTSTSWYIDFSKDKQFR